MYICKNIFILSVSISCFFCFVFLIRAWLTGRWQRQFVQFWFPNITDWQPNGAPPRSLYYFLLPSLQLLSTFTNQNRFQSTSLLCQKGTSKKNNALITIDNLKTLSFFFYYSTNSQRMPVVNEFGPYFVVCHSSPPAGPFLCFRFRFSAQQANKGTGLKTRWVSASQSNTDPTPLQWQQHRWVNILTQYRPVQIVIWS